MKSIFLLNKFVKFIALSFLLSTLLLACKKKSVVPDETEHKPSDKHGEVIGNPIQKIIGVSGGTISTPDANVKLLIPEGALKSDVNISIQEVKSTLGVIAIGKTYRLLPENIQFEKEVELTFNYTTQDLNGSRRELIYLAYQDSKGNWYKAGQSSYDPYSNKVSVKTKHFSDWTAWASARMIIDGKDELLAKETAKFSVVYVDPPSSTVGIDELLGPVPTGLVKKWGYIADGRGKLVEDGDKAVYTAPDEIQIGIYLEISATVDMKKLKIGPGRPIPDYAYFLKYDLKLLSDEYIYWDNQDGIPRFFSEKVEKTFASDGSMSIIGRIGTTGTTFTKNIRIYNSKTSTGDYLFAGYDKTFVSLYNAGYNFSSIYTCASEEKYTLGSVFITKNEGGYIEGKIGGTLQLTTKPCSDYEAERIVGKFRIKKD